MRNKITISFILLMFTIIMVQTNLVYAEDFYNDYVYPTTFYSKGVEKAFSIQNSGLSENVSKVDGSLEVQHTDLTLKGRNGLDFTLSRYFRNENANLYETGTYLNSFKVWQPLYYYWIVTDRRVVVINSKTGQLMKDELLWDDKRMAGVQYYQAALREEELYKNGSYDSVHVSGDYIYYYRYQDVKIQKDIGSQFVTNYSDYVIDHDTTYALKSYSGIGVGWQFDLPHMEIRGNYKYLINGSNGSYQVSFEDKYKPSNLVDYGLKDLAVEQDSGTFSNGTMSSSYVMTSKDGRKTYFGSDGRLLGIKDRYGNQITFQHKSITMQHVTSGALGEYTELINLNLVNKVIDTVGREININYSGSQTIVTVNDPNNSGNNKTIVYNLSDSYSNPCRLNSVVDSENNTTRYEYEEKTQFFSHVNREPGYHQFFPDTKLFVRNAYMKKITYPTGAYVQYDYTYPEIGPDYYTRFLGNEGYIEFFKVGKRSEYKKDGTLLNNQEFKYSNYYNGDGAIEYDGYPYQYNTSLSKDITTTVTDMSGNSETHKYNYLWGTLVRLKIPLCRSITKEGTDHKIEVINEYDQANKMLQKTIERTYNKSNNQYMVKVENFQYDDYRDLTGYWGSQAQRDDQFKTIDNGDGDYYIQEPTYNVLNDENKVTSSYHPTYHYLTGKTYKKDANTTIREEYAPTGDGKGIEWAKVFENEGLKNLSWFGYDSYGNVSASRSYLDNWTDYTQTNYSYTDNDSNRSGKFNGLYITRKWIDGIKDADGNLIEAKGGNPSGTIDENYKYDWFGNVLEKQDGTGNTLSYTYDKLGRVLKETNPDGTLKTFGYTINLTENSVKTTDENGVQLKYIYDEFGNLLYAKDVQTGENLSSSTYDEKMRLKTDSNINSSSDGCIITYQYYTDNRAKQKEVKDKSGRLVAQENYSYDNADSNGQYLKITRVIKGDTNSPDITTTTYVNKHGQVEKQGRMNQGTEYIDTFKYDYLGNKVEEKTARANNENWGEAFTTQYAYNHAGKAVRVTNIEGRSTTTEYDALGRVKAVTDYKGNRTNYTYDSLGRLLVEEIPFEANGKSIKKTYYNRNGNVSSQQVTNSKPGEALNYNQMKYDYDSRNRLTKVTTYDSGTPENYTQYYYDNAGNKLRMYTGLSAPLTISGLDAVQPNGDSEYSTTKYAYDRFNRLIEKVDPLGKTESYTYDLNGTNIRQTDRNGSIITASMDGLKRTISKSVVTADHTGDTTYSYGYTLTGNRLSMNGGGINTTYAYDSLGRLALESSTDGITKEYTYDAGNNRKTFKVKQNGAEKESTSYNYDNMDRLSKAYENGQLIATYAYDANGNRDTLTYGNGVWTKYEYNLNNKLKSLSNKNAAGTELSKFDYTYYLDGNQSSKSDQTGITNYKYDGLGRINTVEGPNGLFKQYGYDDRNNRSDLTGTGEIFTYAEDMTFQYDGFNQLKSAVGIHNVSFTYNGDGLRRTKTVDGVTTTQVLDGGNIDLEIKGTEVTKYVRGVNLIAMEKNGQRYYYLYNGHGDVVQIVDNAGNVVNNYTYDEWGNITNQTEAVENPFKYCGEYLDSETGLYYLRARYYDPTIGRFINEDSFPGKDNDPLSLNLYTYCGNNPVNLVDPSGHVGIKPDGTYYKATFVDTLLLDYKDEYNNATTDKERDEIAERARILREDNPGQWSVRADRPLDYYMITDVTDKLDRLMRDAEFKHGTNKGIADTSDIMKFYNLVT